MQNEKNLSRNIRIRKPQDRPVIDVDAILAAKVAPLEEEMAALRRDNERLFAALQLIATGLHSLASSTAIASSSSGSTKLILEEHLYQTNYCLNEMVSALRHLGIKSELDGMYMAQIPEPETEEDRHIRNVSDM